MGLEAKRQRRRSAVIEFEWRFNVVRGRVLGGPEKIGWISFYIFLRKCIALSIARKDVFLLFPRERERDTRSAPRLHYNRENSHRRKKTCLSRNSATANYTSLYIFQNADHLRTCGAV